MKNQNVFVYVKHYLTPQGIEYLQSQWFPLVYSIICRQKGFMALTYELDQDLPDCVNLEIRFEDKTSFDHWVAVPFHEDLVRALDSFRSRNYWEVADRSAIEWTSIESKATDQKQKGGLNLSERIFGSFFKFQKSHGPQIPLEERTIDDLRAATGAFLEYAGEHASVNYQDRNIPLSDGSSLSARIYNHELPDESPVLIFFPGCGFVFDLFEVNSIICSRIGYHAGIKVILVQFRLAPENPMPQSLYDGYEAASYIASHPNIFGVDRHQIMLGGWCSGAQCAVAVSNLVRKNHPFPIKHQFLISGRYDLTDSFQQFDEYEKKDLFLSRSFLHHLERRYYGIPPGDDRNPLFSPCCETDFTGFPPTTFFCGEYDALRNDTEDFYQKLQGAGILVEKNIFPGQTHNTIAMRKVLADGQDPSKIVANKIKEQLGQ